MNGIFAGLLTSKGASEMTWVLRSSRFFFIFPVRKLRWVRIYTFCWDKGRQRGKVGKYPTMCFATYLVIKVKWKQCCVFKKQLPFERNSLFLTVENYGMLSTWEDHNLQLTVPLLIAVDSNLWRGTPFWVREKTTRLWKHHFWFFNKLFYPFFALVFVQQMMIFTLF